jgi:ADP-glucose pyrophosphorylase
MLEGSRVGTNARVIDSILASGAVVDADESVSEAVIGQNEEQDDRRRSGDT